MMNMPAQSGIDLSAKFHNSSAEAVDLVAQMLAMDPRKVREAGFGVVLIEIGTSLKS